MIRVLRAPLTEVRAEALIRTVGTDLEPCTPEDERVAVAAGPEMGERLRAFGEVPVGGALVTPGGAPGLPFLIHLVVRSREEPITEDRLRRALRNGLRHAAQWELGTVALPPLGTGAGNLDAEVSARVICESLRDHAFEAPFPREVVVAVGSPYEEEAFLLEVARVFPTSGDPDVPADGSAAADRTGAIAVPGGGRRPEAGGGGS